MEIIKILYKIVENPDNLKNYEELRDYYKKNGPHELEQAISCLLEEKNATTNNNNPE